MELNENKCDMCPFLQENQKSFKLFYERFQLWVAAHNSQKDSFQILILKLLIEYFLEIERG